VGSDLRLAVRRLVRQPGLTIVAVVTLALGVGATTTIFGFVNAVLFRPLAVDRPHELVFLNRAGRGGFPAHSYPDYRDLRDRTTALSGLVAYRFAPMSLGDVAPPAPFDELRAPRASRGARLWGYLATGNYFDVLGVRAALGRTFGQDDDRVPGGHPVAVISHGCWQRRFGGDPAIVGRAIAINGAKYTVLGVMPASFTGTELYFRPEVFVPMAMQAQIEPGNAWLERRQTRNIFVLGRLAPGVTSTQAEASLNAIAAALGREHPALNEGMRIMLSPPGLAGSVLRGPVIGFSAALLALAGLVLLLACTNLTGALLARATDRQRETAICLALGAERRQLLRGPLFESALLNAAGAVAALLLTLWLADVIAAWRPPADFPLTLGLAVDHRLLAFAVGLAALGTLLIGAAPAFHATRTDPIAGLKREIATRRRFGWHLRDVVVVTQIALSGVLLVGSLLVVRSLQHAMELDVGFNPRHAVSVRVDLALQGYDEARGRDFQRRVLERVAALPGIESAGLASSLPLGLDQSTNTMYVEGRPEPRASDVPSAFSYRVTPGYFRTMQTRLVAGRDFEERDDRQGRPVAIVNQAFAAQLLPGENPVGKRFRSGRGGVWIEIVGVAQDGKYQSLGEDPRLVVFYPLAQWYSPTTTIVARASLGGQEALGAIRNAVVELDPALSLFEEGTLEQHLGLTLFPARVAAAALTAFGLVAILLVSVGVYSMVSYGVARRTREICIRLAVGASRRHIVGLVVRRAAGLWLAGAGAGAGLALGGGRVLSPILLDVEPASPGACALAGIILAIVTAVACVLPTRRALHADPAGILRSE
jgi:predicted permease